MSRRTQPTVDQIEQTWQDQQQALHRARVRATVHGWPRRMMLRLLGRA